MREPLFDNDIHPLRHPEIYCLEMVDSREMTRQTDSLAAKAITEVACAPGRAEVSRELETLPAGTKLQTSHRRLPSGVKRGKR